MLLLRALCLHCWPRGQVKEGHRRSTSCTLDQTLTTSTSRHPFSVLTTGWSGAPGNINCICWASIAAAVFCWIKLFLPLISSWVFKCVGGWRYLQFSLEQRPCKREMWALRILQNNLHSISQPIHYGSTGIKAKIVCEPGLSLLNRDVFIQKCLYYLFWILTLTINSTETWLLRGRWTPFLGSGEATSVA